MVLTKTEEIKTSEPLKSTSEVANITKEQASPSSERFFRDEDIEWLLFESGLNKNEISSLQFEEMKRTLTHRILPIIKMTAFNYVKKTLL